MLILLPPSETKRDGGSRSALNLSRLGFAAELTDARTRVTAAVVELAADPETCARALKLSVKQLDEVERNCRLYTSPVMPAMERYTGVLYDALDVLSLPADARSFLGRHVLIQSALLGLVRANDKIPAYRLSHNSTVPGLGPLKRVWAEAGAEILAGKRGLILDLRSEGYAELSPLPERSQAVFVRVVARGSDGKVKALNHFNKKGKGEFLRALALAGRDFRTVDELFAWAAARSQAGGLSIAAGTTNTADAVDTGDFELTPGASGTNEINLVVKNAL